jgi:hypothetical protein
MLQEAGAFHGCYYFITSGPAVLEAVHFYKLIYNHMDIIKVIKPQGQEGKPINNMYILHGMDGDYLQSYDRIIAGKLPEGRIKLDPEYYYYSETTAKHRDFFLQIDRETFKKNLETGIYIMESLNQK